VAVSEIGSSKSPIEARCLSAVDEEFVINLKTAKQIGLMMAPNVLVRADRVIK
jgi:hypothetical protein